jgi:hypothetical protein
VFPVFAHILLLPDVCFEVARASFTVDHIHLWGTTEDENEAVSFLLFWATLVAAGLCWAIIVGWSGHRKLIQSVTKVQRLPTEVIHGFAISVLDVSVNPENPISRRGSLFPGLCGSSACQFSLRVGAKCQRYPTGQCSSLYILQRSHPAVHETDGKRCRVSSSETSPIRSNQDLG